MDDPLNLRFSASTAFRYLPSSIALIFLGCKGQLTRVLAKNFYAKLNIIKVGTKESLSSYKKKIDYLLYQP